MTTQVTKDDVRRYLLGKETDPKKARVTDCAVAGFMLHHPQCLCRVTTYEQATDWFAGASQADIEALVARYEPVRAFGHEFRPFDEFEWDLFAGSQPGTLINVHPDNAPAEDDILLLEPNGDVVVVDWDGHETVYHKEPS
jgi:hypothetical protein